MISKNFTLTQGDSLEFTITIEDTQLAPDDIVFSVVDNVNSEEYLWTTWNFSALPDVLYLMSKGCSIISATHFSKDGVAT